MFLPTKQVALQVAEALNKVVEFERYKVLDSPTNTPSTDDIPDNQVIIKDTFLEGVTVHIRNVKGHTILNLGKDGKIARGRPYRLTGNEDYVQLLATRLIKFTKDPHLNSLLQVADARHEQEVLRKRAERKAARLSAKLAGGGSKDVTQEFTTGNVGSTGT